MKIFTKESKLGRFHYDPILVLICASLLFIGYIMVASSSLHLGTKVTENSFHYPIRQTLHIGLGLFLGCGVVLTPINTWQKSGQWLFIVGLVLLVIVLIPGLGVKVNGSTRWLSLGGMRIQVSELVKYFAVIYMAGYVTRHQKSIRESALGLVKPLFLFSVTSLLLLMEPDFGSAVVILIIAMGIMFLAGA